MFCRLTGGPSMSHRGSKQNATQSLCLDPEHKCALGRKWPRKLALFWTWRLWETEPQNRTWKVLIAMTTFPNSAIDIKMTKLTFHSQRSQRELKQSLLQEKTTCPRIPPSAVMLEFSYEDLSLRNSPITFVTHQNSFNWVKSESLKSQWQWEVNKC